MALENRVPEVLNVVEDYIDHERLLESLRVLILRAHVRIRELEIVIMGLS